MDKDTTLEVLAWLNHVVGSSSRPPLLLIGGFVIDYGGKGVVAMMRNFRKIRLTVLSAVLGAIFIMSEKSSEAAVVVLETSKGQVEIEMKPELAPNHVARITELVKKGFYDGIIFHRVIPGFMAQTGDPTGTGTGGSGENLNAEFTDYEYVEGTVGMARAMNPNSADSQFFICFEGCGHLTGQYTVWGQVIDGMDVVRKINEGQPPAKPDKIVSARMKD